MIKIEVTGNSIPEVADKLLAIGGSLQGIKTTVPHTWSDIKPDADIILEVAEAAPVDPTPAAEPAATLASSSKQAEAPTDTSAPATSVSELSFETDVTPVVLAVVQTKGKPVVEEILSQFGVARASQLDPARWPELVAALQDKL
tara:strand:+ start:75 stop:506 length:432 start_codon:yes stop_codon:yes gene_type:complete